MSGKLSSIKFLEVEEMGTSSRLSFDGIGVNFLPPVCSSIRVNSWFFLVVTFFSFSQLNGSSYNFVKLANGFIIIVYKILY